MHDPRVDPRPGDVVARPLPKYERFDGRSIRTVLGRKGGDISYRYDREMNGGMDPYKGRVESCWVITWKDWCRDAEVLHVAGE